MNALQPWFQGTVVVAWLFAPPTFALIALRRRTSREGLGGWRKVSALVLGVAVLTNWAVFVVYLAGGFGEQHESSLPTLLLLGLSLFSVASSHAAFTGRWQLCIANLALVSLWFSFGYAPGHWLTRVDFGSVKIDNRPLPATLYLGTPTNSEAEAIVLVHVPRLGDYFLDLSGETYRETSKQEFILLHYGAWTWRSMRHGQFRPPLPFRKVNECRIPLSDGRVLNVEL